MWAKIRDWWRGRRIAPALHIAERSVSLSGGYRRRPALARAWLGLCRFVRGNWQWLLPLLGLGITVLTYCRP